MLTTHSGFHHHITFNAIVSADARIGGSET